MLSYRLLYCQAGLAQCRPGTEPAITDCWLLTLCCWAQWYIIWKNSCFCNATFIRKSLFSCWTVGLWGHISYLVSSIFSDGIFQCFLKACYLLFLFALRPTHFIVLHWLLVDISNFMWCDISVCICKIVHLLHIEKFVFWKDIPEAPERQMTDKINEVIMLCRFPAEIKSFYMQKDKVDTRVTESVSSHFPYWCICWLFIYSVMHMKISNECNKEASNSLHIGRHHGVDCTFARDHSWDWCRSGEFFWGGGGGLGVRVGNVHVQQQPGCKCFFFAVLSHSLACWIGTCVEAVVAV